MKIFKFFLFMSSFHFKISLSQKFKFNSVINKSILILFIIITFNHSIYSQGGWHWLNPKPQGNYLSAVQYVNSNTIYAIGVWGTILKSTDSGMNWNNVYNNYIINQGSLNFLNENTGYIISKSSVYNNFDTVFILKTTNGGVTWQEIIPNVTGKLGASYFSDINTGYIIVKQIGFHGRLIKTTNGGSQWTQLIPGSYGNISKLSFMNSLTGYCLCDSGIIKTNNGGNNWNFIHIDTSYYYSMMYFINESTGFITSSLGLRAKKTTNGGLSWTYCTTPPINVNIISLNFLNENTGYISGLENGGGYGYIYKTTNSGMNWYLQIQSDGSLNSTSFIDFNKGVTVGDYGQIYVTTNGGSNWFLKWFGTGPKALSTYTSMYFLDKDNGFISTNYYGYILKTNNGGNNWQVSYFDSVSYTVYTKYIWFINSQTGFIAALNPNTNYSQFYRTLNGGNSWDLLFNQYMVYCNTIHFVNSTTGFHNRGTDIFKTTNSGMNWISKYPEGTILINTIGFADVNTGFAGGMQYFKKTTNCGENWFSVPFPLSNLLLPVKIEFKNANTGYVSGFNPSTYATGIYKTTNCGLNWQALPLSPYGSFGSFFSFANTNTGYALSSKYILKTTNGGISWIAQNPRASNVGHIFSVNDSISYACGEFGLIIKTTDGGGVIIGVKKSGEIIPNSFNLHQNYPNPFNPSTIIQYDLPVNSTVSLIIYDMLGREVNRLVNTEYQNAGSYEAEFDGSNLASGVYFYKLVTENFAGIKKMVLLK